MNNLINPSELLNIEQAIDLIGITRVTFYVWLAAGKIKTVTIAGKTFIPQGEADRLIKERNS